MSRIGKQPVVVPAGVKVRVADGKVNVEGPKGKLELAYHRNMKVEFDESGKVVKVARPDDDRTNRALHGLTRSLIANMVQGVTKGFEKRLVIEGIGYQVRMDKKAVVLTVGFANAIALTPPDGVTVALTDPTHIVVTGADKQKVGQFAAEIRAASRPSRTRARACATTTNRYAARKASPSRAVGDDRLAAVRRTAVCEPRLNKMTHGRQSWVAEAGSHGPSKGEAAAAAAATAACPARITGTAERPRLTVFRSNKHIYAQLIDDAQGVTLAAASSLAIKEGDKASYGGSVKGAVVVGKKIAEEAKAKGIARAAFDRGHYKYHGRVKALADAAREGGLQF